MTETTTPGVPPATPAETPLPPVGLALKSLLTADIQTLLRSRTTFILNVMVPLIILGITSRSHRLGSDQAGFLIAMAITYGLLSSALLGYAISTATDRQGGVFQRLRVSPAPSWAIMLSRLLTQLMAAIATVIIVIVAGSIIHHVIFDVGTYLLIFLVSVFGAAMFLGIGQALVGLIPSANAVGAVARVLYIVLILVGILGAAGVLGDNFKTFSEWTPVGALITLFTAVQDVGAWSMTDTGAVLACAGYLVVFAGIGIRWFRWEVD